MIDVKLVHITPDAEKHIAYCARVSNPDNQDNENYVGLLNYCKKHKHWSVFEMANVCLEINAPRDISRQILRHRSFHFQEFSQRYADATQLGFIIRECRLQDTKNRQNSIVTEDTELTNWWDFQVADITRIINNVYQDALDEGIAKEVARTLLPEGLTMSRLYMNGTVRDWIHYCEVRCGNGTQKEHILVAEKCKEILKQHLPNVFGDM